jgi:hypothetical protein
MTPTPTPVMNKSPKCTGGATCWPAAPNVTPTKCARHADCGVGKYCGKPLFDLTSRAPNGLLTIARPVTQRTRGVCDRDGELGDGHVCEQQCTGAPCLQFRLEAGPDVTPTPP